jgi:hypothetical protein
MLALLFIFAQEAHASVSLVQNPNYGSCSLTSATCAVPVSSTGSNHLLVITAMNNNGSAVYLSSVSGGCAVTWQIPTGTQFNGGATNSTGSDAYCLVSSAGATSITITWNSSTPDFSGVQVWEYSFTGTSIALDSGSSGGVGTVNNTSSGTTGAGVPLSLAGANDVIIQMMCVKSVQVTSVATYGNFSSFFGGPPGGTGTADLENTTSGAAPTWTFNGSSISRGNAIAFTEINAPASGYLNPNSKWVGNAVIQ